MNRLHALLALAGMMLTHAACAHSDPAPQAAPTRMRVATYNVEWMNALQPTGRMKNLKSVVKSLDADIIGLQEIQDRLTLTKIFDDSWDYGVYSDKDNRQNPAIAVRKPYVLKSFTLLFPDKALDFAFPNRRDVLHAVVQTPAGETVNLYVLHLKSRRGGRLTTDPQRHQAAALLSDYLKKEKPANAIVLGDFNDAPDDATANILETGDPRAKGGKVEPSLLFNLTEANWERDECTIGLHELFKGEKLSPVVKGAREDNSRLAGKDYNFPADVKVEQTMFDQILVGESLWKRSDKKAVVYTGEDALRGVKEPASARELASDHLPVYADFKLPLTAPLK
jgi:endonuclease/exonuclease/phosphatase family metal-dependent hydrolase